MLPSLCLPSNSHYHSAQRNVFWDETQKNHEFVSGSCCRRPVAMLCLSQAAGARDCPSPCEVTCPVGDPQPFTEQLMPKPSDSCPLGIDPGILHGTPAHRTSCALLHIPLRATAACVSCWLPETALLREGSAAVDAGGRPSCLLMLLFWCV